jgi:hypothetical protein
MPTTQRQFSLSAPGVSYTLVNPWWGGLLQQILQHRHTQTPGGFGGVSVSTIQGKLDPAATDSCLQWRRKRKRTLGLDSVSLITLALSLILYKWKINTSSRVLEEGTTPLLTVVP